MRVLISAGIKTPNIVNTISSRFSSGGVDFVTTSFIQEIDDIYQRGEYFDKAIILEQAWTEDFEELDETAIRSKLSSFSSQTLERGLNDVSIVFLTQTNEMAFKVSEETFMIQSNSVILVKQPSYSVKFFVDLIKTEIDKFPETLVYKPEVAEEVAIDSGDEFDEAFDTDKKPGYEGVYVPDLTADEDFGQFNGNRLPDDEYTDDFSFDPPKEHTSRAQSQIDFNKHDQEYNDTQDDDLGFGGFEDSFQPSGDIGFNAGEIDPGTGFEEQQFGGIPEEPEYYEEPSYSEAEPVYDEPVQEQGFNQSGEIPDYSDSDDGYIGGFSEDLYNEAPVEHQEQPVENRSRQQNQYNHQEEYNVDQWNTDDSIYDSDTQEESQGTTVGGMSDEDYKVEPEVTAPTKKRNSRINLNAKQIRATLDAFANRGNSILVSGCGGCGTSTMALNLAKVINALGYTVLLVDLDTKNKAQSYISKSNFECIEPDSAGLLAAINSSSGINAHIAIVDTGFHLLTMGMGSDSFELSKKVQREKIGRFINLAKTSHNFVVYDIPFDTAINFGKDFTYMADNIVLTVDCSNWGISKLMLNMCNIEDEDMYETLFNRGQLLFNRYRALNKVMGRKVKTAMDITKVMDYKIRDLLGDDPGYYFQSMHICGLINEDPRFEDGWFSATQYSDTQVGYKMFTEILKNIVLKS